MLPAAVRPLFALLVLGGLAACGSATPTAHVAQGLVRDAHTAAPIAGAEVAVSDGATVHQLVTGANGTFSIQVAAASGSITVQAEGYVRATTTYDLAAKNPSVVIALQPATQAVGTTSPLG